MDEGDYQELRRALIRATIGIIPIAALFAIQWWVVTPEPERLAKLRQFGISKCGQGRWRFRGMPHHCLCRWVDGTVDQRLQAGLDEQKNEGWFN